MKRLYVLAALLAVCLQMQSQTVYSLTECRRLATANNKDLQIAGEKVKAANSLRKAAQTQYLPNFSANGIYQLNQKTISLLGEDKYLPVYNTAADGSPSFAQSVNNKWAVIENKPVPLDSKGVPFDPKANPEKIQWKSYAYIPKDAFEADAHNIFIGALTMTQPLFMGGKIRELNRMAESGKRLAEAQLEGETSETIINTDAAYWRIVSLSNKEKLATSYVDLLKKLEKDVEVSIETGVATKSDGLTVRVKLNEAEMSLLQVQDGLTLSKMALCQLCGLPLNAEFKLADEELNFNRGALPAPIQKETAIGNRYEIKSLEQVVELAASNERMMISRFLPNAGLTAGYLTSNPNLYNGIQKTFGGQWNVGVVVNVPLFHWGERVHTLRAAKSERAIAQYKLEDAREKVELDITQAGFRLREADKKAQMTISNKAKAEENLKYASVSFESGVVAASALMEAQTAWLKSCSENIDARIDLEMCRVYLDKALGNLK